MKELIEVLEERIAHIETLGKGYGINARRIAELKWVLKTIQKAKQKEAIEQSTNWQMKEEKPELSVEEFLNKHTPFLVRSYRGCSAVNPFVSASARQKVIKHLANKLTEFKNLNG